MKRDAPLETLLMHDQWETFSPTECEEVARRLETLLPTGFRFHKVGRCTLSNQIHLIAFFEWFGYPEGYDQAFFALIPGGNVLLGYDRRNPFHPSQHQLDSWKRETEPLFEKPLDIYLDLVMTPLRQVTLQPFLLEVSPRPLAPPPLFDPTLGPNGGWKNISIPISHEQTRREIARQGFRFPTSDEWEYACAAEARTLFRWGNETPYHQPPLLGSWKPTEWDLHLRQNAFGLFIARHPYHWEFCAERTIMRGGDGGSMMHAGAGTFATWLTLASAFYQQVDEDETEWFGVYLRRAFSLVSQ